MPRGIGSVEYESGLERDFLLWIGGNSRLTDVASQPFTVGGWIGGSYRRYTPDYLVVMSRAPPELRSLGFESRTVVEVKPAAFAKDVEVQQKLCLVRAVTGLPVVVVTERDINMPLSVEVNHVH
jgi:hypothetical protein